jgi:hypothetical protein
VDNIARQIPRVLHAEKDASVIVISDDEQDEAERCPPSKPLLSHSSREVPGKSRKFPQGERRAKVDVKIGPPGQRKRRRPSESDVEFVEVKDVSKAKKAKRENAKR